jgi:endonuclease/exonuclease/phosphatase family metal-dependent hydrolase
MAWGANYRRICTWGKFEHIATGKTFFVYNAHFDHESQEARENSSRMVLDHIAKNTSSDDPVIFMGDLNADPENEAYHKIIEQGRLRDAYGVSGIPPHGPKGTFNGFSITDEPVRRIDHIFLSDHFSVKRYGILTDSYGGLKYPSDHFPVLAEIEL